MQAVPVTAVAGMLCLSVAGRSSSQIVDTRHARLRMHGTPHWLTPDKVQVGKEGGPSGSSRPMRLCATSAAAVSDVVIDDVPLVRRWSALTGPWAAIGTGVGRR
jgi:hypothetical protein